MEEALARARARTRPPYVNVALFLATLACVTWMQGAPFAAALVGILLTHEMGHYLAARRYGVDTTLPYFIPVPAGIGTFGAVIRIRSAMPSRRATFDIGAAGPFAGFLVALPLFVWGLLHSEVRAVDVAPAADRVASGIDFLRALARGLSGAAEPRAASDVLVFGDSALTWLAQRLVMGPLPAGHEVFIHPVGLAAWFGLFVTALNLVPIGQLDGGHVVYALLGGRRAERASRALSLALLACGLFVSFNWLVWWALARVLVGPRHPPALREEPLGRGRTALAIVALALFAATFVPVPFSS
jgi:membrane-associated protease RseP (regulator of RpoE activity)